MTTLYVVQGFYGEWEDLTASTSREEADDDLRDYMINEPQCAHRIVIRQESEQNV